MNIFDTFDVGWQYAKKYGFGLSLLMLVIFSLICWMTYMCFSSEFWEVYIGIVKSNDLANIDKLQPYIEEAQTKNWIVSMIQYLLYAGVMNIVVSIYTGETKGINLKYLSLPFTTYLSVIEYICLMMLLLMVSAYCLFLPFIFFGIRLMFVIPKILEEPGCSMLKAMRMSWGMTKGRFFDLLGFCLMCMLVMLIGFLCCGIGACFTSVICMFAFMNIYDIIRKQNN